MATILVVDDEPDVRQSMRKILERDGHTVLEAAEGAGALALLRARDDIEIVFVDVYMPGMNGIEFTIRAGQQASPAIVVMSGGGAASATEVIVQAAFLGPTATLAKPFTPAQLLRMVDSVLLARASAR